MARLHFVGSGTQLGAREAQTQVPLKLLEVIRLALFLLA